MSCPGIVIAATGSGVGKTSVTLALVHALKRRGLRVQTFKVGPDFLDPTHLALASGRPCYNLDGWMCGEAYVRDLYRRKTADADITVIEGVMGLFDGASPDTSEGSTAEIARWLGIPVVLIVNAHGVARSIAATVAGFAAFEPAMKLGGVIANHSGSPRHTDWLGDALVSTSLPPLLGAIPREAFPALPSRHLGLVTASRESLSPALLDAFADVLERHVKVEAIMQLGRSAAGLPASPAPARINRPPRVTIGVAQDAAFHFYYPDNLEALREQGARLIPFSPLSDPCLPADLDAVYLGGGYPEEYAAELSGNTGMLDSVRRFVSGNGAVYAECGGLMLLSQGIEMCDGTRHAMAGILPAWTRMCPRRKSLGYAEVSAAGNTMWGPAGTVIRGHEFHYSELMEAPDGAGRWEPAWLVRYRRAGAPVPEGFRQGRVMASYVHLHFAAHPLAAKACVDFAAERKAL